MAMGAIPNIVSAGVYNGFLPGINASSTVLCSAAASSLSMVDFTYVGATSVFGRIVASPSSNKLKFETENVTRMELTNTGATFPGDVSITGRLTGGGVQPLLSSVADDGLTCHSVIGTGSASNKLKAMSAGPGIQLFSTADSLSTTLDLSRFHAVLDFSERN